MSFVDVLVFLVGSTANTYVGKVEATILNNTTISVQLNSSGTNQHKLLFIANQRAKIATIVSAFTTTTTESNALQLLSLGCNTMADIPVDESLPMWGFSKPSVISRDMVANNLYPSENAVGIPLIRSVAKIIIKNNATNFVLESASLYNMNNKYQIGVNQANLNDIKVTQPSLPTGLTKVNYTNNLVDNTTKTAMLYAAEIGRAHV